MIQSPLLAVADHDLQLDAPVILPHILSQQDVHVLSQQDGALYIGGLVADCYPYNSQSPPH